MIFRNFAIQEQTFNGNDFNCRDTLLDDEIISAIDSCPIFDISFVETSLYVDCDRRCLDKFENIYSVFLDISSESHSIGFSLQSL